MSQPASGRFAGLIDGTFGLLRQTWKTTLFCGGIAFLPAAALYGWAYGRLFAAMAGTWVDVVDAPFPFAAMAAPFLLILAAAALQGLALLFVRSCVTAQAAAAVRGGSIPVPAIAGRDLRRTGARLVGQRVLQGLVYAGIFLAAVIVMAIVMAVGGRFNEVSDTSWRVLGLFFLCYVAGIAVWVWLWVRFSLTLESVVIDGSRAGQSFGLSASLVRGNWWRVFGYRILFSIMLGFAASLIATPIVFFATIRAYARYLTEMVQGTADSGSLLDMFRAMGSGLPVRLAGFLYLQSLLNAFFAPVFMTLLYFEMKRRKAEASRSAAEPSAENEPETPDSAPSAPTVAQGGS
ncbi:MAG: hypothetical protein NTU62_06195 [Spirochaetes bacterium]|nr:hypothetical protein [Spirochaetota bacterium]